MKSSKKHNLQKRVPIGSISYRFRDMSNSLNSHNYDVIKITLQYPRLKMKFKPDNNWRNEVNSGQKYPTMVKKNMKHLLVKKLNFSFEKFKKT